MLKDGNLANHPSKTHSEQVPLVGDLLRVCFNLVDVVSGSGFQMLFCLVHHLCKDIWVPNSQVGEHLAFVKYAQRREVHRALPAPRALNAQMLRADVPMP